MNRATALSDERLAHVVRQINGCPIPQPDKICRDESKLLAMSIVQFLQYFDETHG